MNDFRYTIQTEIFFGKTGLNYLAEAVKKYSNKILITYGSTRIETNGFLEQITTDLKQHGVNYHTLSGIKANPSISSVREGIKKIQSEKLTFILAIGGGSVIDASKAMAAGAASNIDPWLFCRNEAQPTAALPIGTILTLSATGSEMNAGAVISNEEVGEKLAFHSPFTRPKFSVLDPTLTFSVPKNQTAAGVVDIFTHVAEQYFDPTTTAGISDRLSEAIMKTCIEYGRIAIDEPENYEARANLMWASSLALNGLLGFGKQGGDWATHIIEHELSAAYDLTHGVGLAILLPHWMKFVLSPSTRDKFATFAKMVFNIDSSSTDAAADAGIEATIAFFRSLDMPIKLSEVEIDHSKIDHMAKQATQFGAIGGFKKLNTADVKAILTAAAD